MRLAAEKGHRAKEISLIDVIENLIISWACGLRDFYAALPNQVERVAGLAFVENCFARFFSQHFNLRRDSFDNIDIDSVEEPIVVKFIDSSGPRSCFHRSAKSAGQRSAFLGAAVSLRIFQARENGPHMVDDFIRRKRFAQKSSDSRVHQTIQSLSLNKPGAENDRHISANFATALR